MLDLLGFGTFVVLFAIGIWQIDVLSYWVWESQYYTMYDVPRPKRDGMLQFLLTGRPVIPDMNTTVIAILCWLLVSFLLSVLVDIKTQSWH